MKIINTTTLILGGADTVNDIYEYLGDLTGEENISGQVEFTFEVHE